MGSVCTLLQRLSPGGMPLPLQDKLACISQTAFHHVCSVPWVLSAFDFQTTWINSSVRKRDSVANLAPS